MANTHYFNRIRRVRVLIFCLAVCGLIIGAAAAQAENDLLQLPSKKSKLAQTSRFYDVVAAGDRLVAVGERGHILYSDDHGVTWTQADVPVRVALTAVCFPSDGKGWAVGHDAVVLHTVDGGKTWVKQLDGFQVNDLELALYQDLLETLQAELQKLETVAEGEEGDKEALKEDLALEIEDLQYKLEDVQLDKEDGAWKPLLDLWFDGEGRGIVVGVFGTILSTDDGGRTWQSISHRVSNPDGYHYKSIARAGDMLIIGGEIGNIYRSSDRGRTWAQMDSPSEASFFNMVANGTGDIVVGTSFKGGMVYSRDQGTSWDEVRAKTRATLADGTALGDGSVAVVSYAGEVFKIAANSANISVAGIARAKFPGMTSVAATGDGHLVAAGQKGLVRITLQ